MWARKITGWVGLLVWLAVACGGDDPPTSRPNPEAICVVDAECESGRCDPRQGCVACLFDHDCPQAHRCHNRECREVVRCSATEHCAGSLTPACDENAGECVACLGDADCAGTAHCVEQQCRPYSACSANADCPDGVCDRERGECVECVAASDCSKGDLCLNARCERPCQGEKDCSAGKPFCGPQSLCVECATNSHCPDVYHCAAGRCSLDVCEGAAKRCDASERGIDTCNASGSGFTTRPCAANQSCTQPADAPECVAWTCEPESVTCSEDGKAVELCSADGLSIASRTDCNPDEVCVDGACAERVCKPQEFSCEDGKLFRCSDDGRSDDLIRTCQSGEICSADEEECLPLVCTPQAPACDGNAVRSCNDTGTGFTGKADRCEDDQTCFDGECVRRVCISDYQCNGDDSFQCVDSGTRLKLAEHCDTTAASPTYCNSDTGRCERVGCDPSQPVCSGEFATVCADDGSGPIAGGVDCTLLDEACFAGNCEPVLCSDDFTCEDGDLYACEDNGTALRLQGECGRPALCDAQAGRCLVELCTPGEPICSGAIATTCDEAGTGYEPGGTDCADQGQGCSDGTCLPLVCAPDAYFCSDGNIHLCDPTGTDAPLADVCESGEHCVTGEPTCVPNACSPGAPVCVAGVATTCRSDGSGPEPGGTDCTLAGQACQLGECRPLVCTPSERFCATDGHVRLCNDTGTNSGPYDTCLPEEYCDGTDVAHCRADRCTAGGPACSGESLATCNADGSGYSAVGTDCSLSGQVCDLALGCADTATDTLGGSEISSENPHATLYLIALETLTSRTLVELEASFAVPMDTQVTWLVYSSSTSAGTYSKLFETTTTVGFGGAALHSSGAISVPLAAGAYYAVGLLVNGAHTEFHSTGEFRAVSFGAAVGSARVNAAAVLSELWIESSSASTLHMRTRTQ